jgi:hypothetical protein
VPGCSATVWELRGCWLHVVGRVRICWDSNGPAICARPERGLRAACWLQASFVTAVGLRTPANPHRALQIAGRYEITRPPTHRPSRTRPADLEYLPGRQRLQDPAAGGDGVPSRQPGESAARLLQVSASRGHRSTCLLVAKLLINCHQHLSIYPDIHASIWPRPCCVFCGPPTARPVRSRSPRE